MLGGVLRCNRAMVLFASIVGAALAVGYVGFLAVSVGKPPLLVIAGLGLCLMFVALWQDIRDSRSQR